MARCLISAPIVEDTFDSVEIIMTIRHSIRLQSSTIGTHTKPFGPVHAIIDTVIPAVVPYHPWGLKVLIDDYTRDERHSRYSWWWFVDNLAGPNYLLDTKKQQKVKTRFSLWFSFKWIILLMDVDRINWIRIILDTFGFFVGDSAEFTFLFIAPLQQQYRMSHAP